MAHITFASWKHLKTALIAMGASLDERALKHGSALLVDAPPRQVWSATHTHAVRLPFEPGELHYAVAEMAKLIDMGTQPCTERECDHCEEADAS